MSSDVGCQTPDLLDDLERFMLASDSPRLHHAVTPEAMNMTTWHKPYFTELSMNAEIGSYQEDGGGRGNAPPVAPAKATNQEPRDEET